VMSMARQSARLRDVFHVTNCTLDGNGIFSPVTTNLNQRMKQKLTSLRCGFQSLQGGGRPS
jgi:hypothetical protein